MMAESMKDMGYYLVLAFAAAHFVAMFGWSNLGLISAVHGAAAIDSTGLPLPIVLGLMVVFTGLLNLFVGSASAKARGAAHDACTRVHGQVHRHVRRRGRSLT